MSFVDVSSGAQEAARRAAQEAARKAAEEAARRAAEEAARRAAEEAARAAAIDEAKAAQAGAALPADGARAKKAITSRLSAYEAEAAASPAAPHSPAAGAASGVPARFGFGGLGKAVGDAVSQVADAAAGAVSQLSQGPDPIAQAQQDEVDKAKGQAGMSPEDELAAARKAQEEAEIRRANAAVPLDAEDERVTRDLNEQELQAYKELSVDDRKALNEVYQYLYCEDQSGTETRPPRAPGRRRAGGPAT